MHARLSTSDKPWIGGFLILGCLLIALLGAHPAVSAMTNKVPADWIVLDVGGKFELKAPPGSAHVPGRGIDSMVGRIKTPAFMLAFDYGAYSDPLKAESAYQKYQAREVQIGGKAARIVTALAPGRSADRPYFIGVHFPNLKQSVIGPIRLTMTAWVKAPKDYDAIEAVFASISFK